MLIHTDYSCLDLVQEPDVQLVFEVPLELREEASGFFVPDSILRSGRSSGAVSCLTVKDQSGSSVEETMWLAGPTPTQGSMRRSAVLRCSRLNLENLSRFLHKQGKMKAEGLFEQTCVCVCGRGQRSHGSISVLCYAKV